MEPLDPPARSIEQVGRDLAGALSSQAAASRAQIAADRESAEADAEVQRLERELRDARAAEEKAMGAAESSS